MKKLISLLIFLLTSTQLTNTYLLTLQPRHCRSPFSNFGSWPYYSYDYYDRTFCPKAYDDYYS